MTTHDDNAATAKWHDETVTAVDGGSRKEDEFVTPHSLLFFLSCLKLKDVFLCLQPLHYLPLRTFTIRTD